MKNEIDISNLAVTSFKLSIRKYPFLFILGLVVCLLQAPVQYALPQSPQNQLISFSLGFIILIPLYYGITNSIYGMINDEPWIERIFSGFRIWIKTIAVTILSIVMIILGFCLFIIPGIILTLGLTPIMLVTTNEKLGIIDSIHRSWNLMKGDKANLFVASILFGIMVLPISLIAHFGAPYLFGLTYTEYASIPTDAAIAQTTLPITYILATLTTQAALFPFGYTLYAVLYKMLIENENNAVEA